MMNNWYWLILFNDNEVLIEYNEGEVWEVLVYKGNI